MDEHVPKVSLEDLLSRAEDLVDAFQFELAREYVQQALKLDRSSCRALQLHAAVSIELGDISSGRDALLAAVQVAPEQGADKYLALAQLCSGAEALGLFTKGVSLMTAADMSEDDRTAASSAMCAVAELFMTDLCEEPDAEGRCQEALRQASQLCPSNPEVHRVESDFLLVQGRPAEAAAAMDKCFTAWAQAEEAGQRMSFEFRVACAKLLIEMQRWDEAEAILEQAIEEDDEAVLPWYLLGVSCAVRDDGVADQDTAREALSMAEHLLMRECEDDRDEELLLSVRQFLGDLCGE